MEERDTHEPRAWRWRWFALVVLAVLYGVCLPRTVQTLDSGELVAAAWKLTVPHPPGYPLFVWLQHLFMRVCPWGSVFHRAALGNALCVLGAVALLLRLARSWQGVAMIAALGTAPVVWRYAVLPDVFGLHLLLSAALLALAFEAPSPRRIWLAALVFGLGAANHQSIIFISPLLALMAWEERSRARAFAALAAGALVTVCLYASLLALDVNALDSWGMLTGASDVVDHFLRKSYGTFRLSGYATEADFVKVLVSFASTCAAFGAAALVFVIAGCLQQRHDRAWTVTLLCLVVYIVIFFPRMNSGAHMLHDGVRERFFLFPMLLLAALATRVVLPRGRVPWLSPALSGVLVLVCAVQIATADAYGYRDDTVVEDYARNLLSIAKASGKPALLIVESDSQLFSLQYVSAVDDRYGDVVAFGMGNIFQVDRLNKVKERWPLFTFDVDQIFQDDRRELFRSFIGPNLEHFAVFSTVPVINPQWRTTFYPLGRRIEAGTGIAIADAPIEASPPVHKADASEYVETKELYADYAVYYLAQGKALIGSGDTEGAKSAFLAGLARVPYCIPCLKNFCTLDGNRDERCGTTLTDLQDNEYHYLE